MADFVGVSVRYDAVSSSQHTTLKKKGIYIWCYDANAPATLGLGRFWDEGGASFL